MSQQAPQQPRSSALTIAPRHTKPPQFKGTEVAWRSLCDTQPGAEGPEVLLAYLDYCVVRKLDPYKKPANIISMWNSRLRRRVQMILPGINEIEITASRTGQWAGMDAPEWGPTQTRTFTGMAEDDQGTKRQVNIDMSFPESCTVTVYRMVGGERRAFTEQLFWLESYGRAGFRSDVPNARWQLAPRQMLHKCTKAAVLRAAFPEANMEYASEEMEGREVEAGGIVIDAEPAQPPPTAKQVGNGQVIDNAPPEPPPEAEPPPYDEMPSVPDLRLLEGDLGNEWLRRLELLLEGARSLDEVASIAGHASVRAALDGAGNTPPAIRSKIDRMLHVAGQKHGAVMSDDAPMDALLAEIETMDADAISGLARNEAWKRKVAAATQGFLPDEERISDAIANRHVALSNLGAA